MAISAAKFRVNSIKFTDNDLMDMEIEMMKLVVKMAPSDSATGPRPPAVS